MDSILDRIGPWTEVKLDIVKKYAGAYSTILAAQRKTKFSHVYIDAFAGTGLHLSRKSGEFVRGSPLNALLIQPEFDDYYFIDIDRKKVKVLRELADSKPDKIHLDEGDCNAILLERVFPQVRWKDYRRGLCLLDPYGLGIDWTVVKTAGKQKTLEIFYNLSIYDMNLNVLLRNPSRVKAEHIARMDRAWGDHSWYDVVYSLNGNLFGYPEKVHAADEAIADAFRNRLTQIAGFSYVPKPMPMRNSKGNVIYYLYFASHNETGKDIVEDIFRKYRNRGT
jgi:three-Cys-motif partner protein